MTVLLTVIILVFFRAVSTVVENLTLNFNGDIDVPELPELQLKDFFEDISKCFPNLKNVNFCIDFTFNAEGFLTVCFSVL